MIMEQILLVQPATIRVQHAMRDQVITVIPVQLLEPLRCLTLVLVALLTSNLPMFAPLALFHAIPAASYRLTVLPAQPRAIFLLISVSAITAITPTDSFVHRAMFAAKLAQ